VQPLSANASDTVMVAHRHTATATVATKHTMLDRPGELLDPRHGEALMPVRCDQMNSTRRRF
jgi:hypothetical protein